MNFPVELKKLIQSDPALVLNGVSVAPGATTVTAFGFDSSLNITSAKGATLPGAEAGYAKGCMFILTSATNGVNCRYVNLGDATTANFKVSSYVTDSAPTKSANLRLYTGTVTGTLAVGETITQATSSATGVIVAKGTGYIDINTVTGTFDATHLVTGGTSGATFTPTMTALNIWTPTYTPVTPINGAKSATQYTQVSQSVLLTTGTFRFKSALNQIETLLSDAVSTFNLEYGI